MSSPPPQKDEAKALFARGKELFEAGERLDALACLEKARCLDGSDPLCDSFYGLLLALERGQAQRGRSLCAEALERAPGEVDAYLNLVRVQLRLGQKAEAIETLREGLRSLPDEPRLKNALERFGIRKPPPFRSLPRAHPLNKYTGLLLARLGLR